MTGQATRSLAPATLADEDTTNLGGNDVSEG